MNKKIFVVFIFGILLLGSVSAGIFDNKFSWDEKKDYQMGNKLIEYNSLWDRYNPIEIRGGLFGLGGTKAKIALTQHTEVCGQDCLSTIEIYLAEDGVLVEDIIFETLQEDGSWIEQDIRSYDFNYLNEEDWISYNVGEEVEAGTYTLELKGQKKPSRTVDWKITTQGKLIEELAVWGNISEGDDAEVILNSPADDSTFFNFENTFNASANVIGGANLVNISLWTNESGVWELEENYTIPSSNQANPSGLSMSLASLGDETWRGQCFMVDSDYFLNKIHMPITGANRVRLYRNESFVKTGSISGSDVFFSDHLLSSEYEYCIMFDGLGSNFETGRTTGVSYPILSSSGNLTYTRGATGALPAISYLPTESLGTNNIYFSIFATSFSKDFSANITKDIIWNFQACDSDGDCGFASANYSLFIDLIPPSITLTAPPSTIESHSIGNPLNLNWTVTDINLDACWYNYDNTNTTVTCGDNTTTFNTVTGEQMITFYANDSVGNENSTNTSWGYDFLEGFVDFEFNISETSYQNFEINITTDIDVQSISAILTYNGTNHTSIASCEGGNCTVLNMLDVPLVPTGEFTPYDFFWTLSIFNGTESSSVVTSTREQNASRIHLEECGGAYTTESLNFKAYDEQNLTRINPYKFDATFNQWLGSGGVKRQSNFSQASIADEALCILPDNETYFIDAIIEYDEVGNGTTYTERNYFFQNDTINNVSQDISLYLLQSSSSTSFILKVQDDSLLPVENVLIEINRFYPGTNEFRIVQIARTDDLGKSVGFFETEIVDYKFFITFNNEILLETGLQKVIPESSPFTLTFNIGDPLGEPWSSQLPLDDLNSSLVWNETSGFITYIYIDSSNNFTLARLLVIKESLTNVSANEILCNENSSLLSATLTCNVGDDSGFYVASSFITRDSVEQLDKQFSFQIETLSGVVGLLGLFFGWFIILIASFMFKFNEIAGIWAITMTVFLINLIGLINFGAVFVTATIGVAIIITWVMER